MDWIIQNWVEIIGAVLGFIFLLLEIKENKWLWPVGLFTSLLYIYVFFVAKFYADMSLQFYYVAVSIYGWVHWTDSKDENLKLEVSHLSRNLGVKLIIISAILYVLIGYILDNYTDSTIPFWDAFTTSLSIVATWMLARKILEQWLVWVFINSISLGLYVYKGLYPTSILFFFYTVLALYGYLNWEKSMSKRKISV